MCGVGSGAWGIRGGGGGGGGGGGRERQREEGGGCVGIGRGEWEEGRKTGKTRGIRRGFRVA